MTPAPAPEAPPVVNVETLQMELDRLMGGYEAHDQNRSQKGFDALLALVLLGMGSVFALRWRATFLLPPLLVVGAGAYLLYSAYGFWRRGPRMLAALDDRLAVLAPNLPFVDRINLRWEDRRRLHNRLFNCTHGVAADIMHVLEVGGDRESLTYLKSLEGSGNYSAILAPRYPPSLRTAAARHAAALEKKLERETAAETLLRPGDSAAPQELLRPVSHHSAAPEQLLRAERTAEEPE